MKTLFAFTIIAFVSGFTFLSKWTTDSSQSKINFTVKGPFGTVHGKFTGLKSDINFDPKNLEGSSIKASIDAKTVSTGVGLRNRDLRKKEEWLDTDKYPRISFQSTKIEKKETGYLALGELTIKDKTRPVEIPFTFTGKGKTGEFKGKMIIHREDFNVGKKGGSVGNDVTINLDIPVKK